MEIDEFFEQEINGTIPGKSIPIRDILLCSIEPKIHRILKKEISFLNPRAYMSSLSIKHAYDRRPIFVKNRIKDIEKVIGNPDYVFKNHNKKGDFIFVRKVPDKKNKFLCCPIEICLRESNHMSIKCVTFFPTKSKSYLQKFPTVWDREGGLVLHHDTELAQGAQQ